MSDLFYRNMSSRMAETIQSDLEITVNVRLRDIERGAAAYRKYDKAS